MQPKSLRSAGGVLRADLSYRSDIDPAGARRYCYVASDGGEAPTLRVHPGDLLILHLTNDVQVPSATNQPGPHAHRAESGGCTSGTMSAFATNLHFHGLSVPPVCHQDEVLSTLVGPGDRPFEYRFKIPENEPPGLYWYHPHVHGFSTAQVLGGASGAIIVEGVEHANPSLAGMPERLLIIRDQELVNPNAIAVTTDSMPPPMVMRDAEGDILNTGTGGGKPAKDLSINFVPVAFPNYPPALIKLRPGQRELWRILNASAITYLDLQFLIDGQLQAIGVVSLDGVPLHASSSSPAGALWQSHAVIPPAGRVEVIVKAPGVGAKASLVTRTVDTGPAGENDPTRPLATIVADPDAPILAASADGSKVLHGEPTFEWLGDAKPVRSRTLYFSEKPHDPNVANSPTDFFITVDGQEPKLFDPGQTRADVVVHQGDVEDWTIENRTRELHAFHIHQIHFILREWNGIPLNEPYLRDTVNVGYWDGQSAQFPSVKLRMDFRDPNVVGTFVYHCHLLEHEDGGMMGLIRVEPRHADRQHR